MNPDTAVPGRRGEASQVDKYLVFAFGVIFVSVLLWLVFRTNQPLTTDQARLVHLVSALAAAGVGAALPGALHLQYRPVLRAGGAIALFVLVFVYQPERAVAPEGTWPVQDPSAVVQEHLARIDAGQYEEAYAQLSAEARKRFSKDEFLRAFESGRRPFGEVEARAFRGVMAAAQLPDGTRGEFKSYGYVTRFKSGVVAFEPIVAVAEGGNTWGILFHNVFPCPNGDCDQGGGLRPAAAPPAAAPPSAPKP